MRQLCAASLLQFLLDFPVGPRRLQQHLQFLLANLSYEHEEGRLEVTAFLQQVGGGTCPGGGQQPPDEHLDARTERRPPAST